MFRRYKDQMSKINELIRENEALKEDLVKNTKKLDKIMKWAEAAEKQNGVLVLSDISTDLIEKLTKLADDNTIILFTKDGERIEIKSNNVQYYNRKGLVK